MHLAVMYSKGEGVPENYVEAYKWWALSAAQGNATAKKGRDLLRDIMTPDQIAEGQKLAAEWKPRP
jgi:TPR repeat protein